MTGILLFGGGVYMLGQDHQANDSVILSRYPDLVSFFPISGERKYFMVYSSVPGQRHGSYKLCCNRLELTCYTTEKGGFSLKFLFLLSIHNRLSVFSTRHSARMDVS